MVPRERVLVRVDDQHHPEGLVSSVAFSENPTGGRWTWHSRDTSLFLCHANRTGIRVRSVPFSRDSKRQMAGRHRRSHALRQWRTMARASAYFACSRPPGNPGDFPVAPETFDIMDASISRIHCHELSLHGRVHQRRSPKYRNRADNPRSAQYVTCLDVGGADTRRFDERRCRASPWISVGRRSTDLSGLALGR